MGENQLALAVLCVLDEDVDLVADREFRIVAEFVDADNTFALVADVDDHFALVESDDGTFDHFVLSDAGKRLAVALFGSLLVGCVEAVVFKCFPVERCVVCGCVGFFLLGSNLYRFLCGFSDHLCLRLSCHLFHDFVFNFFCHFCNLLSNK